MRSALSSNERFCWIFLVFQKDTHPTMVLTLRERGATMHFIVYGLLRGHPFRTSGENRDFQTPLPRQSGFNNRIPLEITIDVRFSKTPPPPGKPDVLNGWPLKHFCRLEYWLISKLWIFVQLQIQNLFFQSFFVDSFPFTLYILFVSCQQKKSSLGKVVHLHEYLDYLLNDS